MKTHKAIKWVAALTVSAALNVTADDYWWNGADWDAGLTESWLDAQTGGTPVTPAFTTGAGDNLIFSADGVTANTVNVSGNQAANNLYFAHEGLTLTSAASLNISGTVWALADTSITAGTVTFKSVSVAEGKTLTLAAGTGNSGNFLDGDGLRGTGTLKLTAGNFTTGNMHVRNGSLTAGGLLLTGGTLSSSGAFQIGNSAAGLVTVAGGELRSNGSGGQINVGRVGSGSGRLLITGGTVSGTASTSGAPMYIGRGGGAGVVDLESGALLLKTNHTSPNPLSIGEDGGSKGTLNIKGGAAQAYGISFGKNGNASTTGTLSVSGGLLRLADGGIVSENTVAPNNYAVILSGGTVGVDANSAAGWSSSLNMTLAKNAGGGQVTFAAQDANFNDKKIELSGVLSGTGGLTVGGGTLLLSGANTYEGDTIVSAGTLQLDNALALGGVADLKLSGGVTVNLNFGDGNTATVDRLWLDGVIISGLEINTAYTASELNGFLSGNTIFTGDSKLIISAIPEPSTWALLLIGSALLVTLKMPRSKTQRRQVF